MPRHTNAQLCKSKRREEQKGNLTVLLLQHFQKFPGLHIEQFGDAAYGFK
jgi:hypothetical protein